MGSPAHRLIDSAAQASQIRPSRTRLVVHAFDRRVFRATAKPTMIPARSIARCGRSACECRSDREGRVCGVRSPIDTAAWWSVFFIGLEETSRGRQNRGIWLAWQAIRVEDTPQNPDAADRRELLEVLARAFRDNPMNVEIHGPRPTRRVRANRAGLRALVLDTDRETIARVIRHEGRVVGGFVAAPPGLRPLPNPSFRRQFGCFIHQGARAMDRWGILTHALSEFRPIFDHWYLSVLGVEPSLHGRGFGGRLIEALFDLMSELPAPLYLESDREASVAFYRARGFEERGEARVHGVRCWCLGRGFADESLDLCDSVRQA